MAMLGTATKLKNARNITIKGAVSGTTSFDGSKNIEINTTFSGISILTGNFTMTAQNDYSKDINYPEGFNKNNCIVIAFGICTQNDANAKGYNYFGFFENSSDLLNNGLKRSVNLRDSGIHIIVNKTGGAGNYSYKIGLLKI